MVVNRPLLFSVGAGFFVLRCSSLRCGPDDTAPQPELLGQSPPSVAPLRPGPSPPPVPLPPWALSFSRAL